MVTVGPAADDGREQPGAATGVDEQQAVGPELGRASRRASRSGTPSAMPPAPRTSSLPGICSRSCSSASSVSRSQPASANTRACSGPTTRTQSKPSTSFGWCSVRRHAANVLASWSAVARHLVDDAARPFAGEHGDRVVVGGEPAADGQRRERRVDLVLGEAEAELAGVAVGGPVDLAGPAAADVAHDQLHGAADREVGPVALTERVDAAVHARSPACRDRCR